MAGRGEALGVIWVADEDAAAAETEREEEAGDILGDPLLGGGPALLLSLSPAIVPGFINPDLSNSKCT